ncbi:MAG: acyl-CoA dehydratase activase [Tepidanaerobacteraceae bacterium]|jgi:benzoyl-CoA reductase subunit A
MTQEFWKWQESSWTSDSIDWKTAKTIEAGVDIGTTSTQAAIMCEGALFGYANIRTGANFLRAASTALKKALGVSGMTIKDIHCIGATGWGGRNLKYATNVFDEVHCHAKGARFMFGPKVHTVVDMGGQTVKAIRLYDWDRVRDFMMNDKCATGMGRNIEFLCDLLQVPIEEIGEKSLDVEKDPEPVATSCYVFANSETMGLFGRPEFRSEPLTENEVYAKHMFAVTWRILGTIGKIQPLDVGDIRIYPELGFTGGLAKNVGVTKRIERELNVKALKSQYDPMLAGAIGAALLAKGGMRNE